MAILKKCANVSIKKSTPAKYRFSIEIATQSRDEASKRSSKAEKMAEKLYLKSILKSRDNGRLNVHHHQQIFADLYSLFVPSELQTFE